MLRCARRLYRTTHATEPTRRNPRGTEGGGTGEIRGRDGGETGRCGEIPRCTRRAAVLTRGRLHVRARGPVTLDSLLWRYGTRPVTGVGEWSLDKRHFMDHYPSKRLEPPPK